MPVISLRWRLRLACPTFRPTFKLTLAHATVALLIIAPWVVQAQPASPGKTITPAPIQPRTTEIPPLQKAQLDSARSLLEAGRTLEAVEGFQKLIETSPDSPLVPEAYLLIGQALSGMQKWEEANIYFRRLLEEAPASAFVTEARVGLATGLLKTGQWDAALPLLRQANVEATSPVLKLGILRRLEEAYLIKPDYPRAIEAALDARPLVSPEEGRAIEDRVRLLLYSKASEADLRRVAERFPQSFPGDLAMLRLLEQYAATGEDYKLTHTAREFFKQFPTHEQIATVTSFLTAQRKKLKTNELLLGALLPLSGPLSPYGTQILNGIKIALEQMFEFVPRRTIGLVTKDTENDQKQLMLELDDLLEDYRPVAVIGPLLTRDLKTVAPAADARDAVFFTPAATYAEVQRLARSLFNAAINNRDLVRDVAEYAILRSGWKRICILAPLDSYGNEMTQAFAEEIRRLGAELIANDTYDAKDTDFGPAIKRLKAADLKKYGKLEPIKKKGKRTKNYTPGFDAIFLPDDVEKVALLAGQLHFYGMAVPILGTNALNSPELVRIGGRSVEGTVFADSFFVDNPNPVVRDFVNRYRARFHEAPTAFAAQAYEATQLILNAVLNGATTGKAIRESLRRVKDAPGLSGPLTMNPAGYLERRYTLIQVKGGRLMALTDAR
jgi:branched-chain amino acid transport system substrate-binding protein